MSFAELSARQVEGFLILEQALAAESARNNRTGRDCARSEASEFWEDEHGEHNTRRTLSVISGGVGTTGVSDWGCNLDACRCGGADWRTAEQYTGAGSGYHFAGTVDNGTGQREHIGGIVHRAQSGFGLAPMISGLVSLLAAEMPAPPALVKCDAGGSSFQAAESGGRITNVDYDQMGLPRESSGVTNGTGSSACEWRAADHRERTGDGRTLISRPEQRHCTGGAGRDAQYERDQRCSERALIWPLSLN
jgi:hypothetical protein